MNQEKSIKRTAMGRIESIDIFRGLTIFLMVFVNDLTPVTNITSWLKHMPDNISGMTIPDIVFPAFLFIVGMSIPLAFKKRIVEEGSKIKIIKHIAIRSLSLLILGVLMVNIGRINPELTGISRNLWSLLMFIFVSLLWNIYPRSDKSKKLYLLFKTIGAAGLLWIVVIYRSGTFEDMGWLDTSWWGILGLIGWAYFISAISYLYSKNSLAVMISVLSLLIVIYIGDQSGALDFLLFNKSFLLIGPHLAGHAAITTTGIILTIIFQRDGFLSDSSLKIKHALYYALLLAFIGFCFESLYGVHKIQTTPSFVFYSSSICVMFFVFLYWIVDIKKYNKLFSIFNPAGSNPLLAYILPSIIYSFISLIGLSAYFGFWRDGFLGILKSILFTFFILLLTHYLTKLKIQLKL